MESATFFFVLTLLTATVGKNFHYTGRNLTHVPIDSIAPDTYTVRLSNNEISHLGSFNAIPYMRHLYIDNNRVNNLSPQTFQRLDELRLLDLNRNYIVSLRDFVFSDLVALWTLYLSNNLISGISERAFYGLASLEFLELSGNRLSAVPMQTIRLIPSKQLLLVSLTVNNISQIPGDITSAHPSASYRLQGNPLRCPDEQVSRRHAVESVSEAFVVKDFSTEDSGMYTSEMGWRGSTRTYYCDILLCLADWRPGDKQEQNTTTSPPPNDFLPRGENNTDTCAGSTNDSCCSYWLIFKPSFHQKFCDAENTNSQENPTVLFIIAIVVGILVILFSTAIFCWRKRRNSREKIYRTSGAILQMGVQAMAVCIPLHTLPELTAGYSAEGESSPNAFPLRRLRSPETDWSAKKMGATQYSFHCVAEALPADTLGITEAQVHHYENDDAADADEEVQCHQYASAAPPPLPVYEGDATDAVNTAVHCHNEVLEEPAFQIGTADSDETEMPYGVAVANSLYRRDTALNSALSHSEHTSNSTSNDSAVEANQIEERPCAIADTNALYPRDPDPIQHASSAAANYCGTDMNQMQTVTTDLYGQQTNRTDMSRDVKMTSSHDSAEDFGILYGSGPATVE
ncbi:LGR4 [Branchiostoma lanceolatum]|uniref:LGR4 protein n=1 Tax=Branchiostoma lanceolatum TaxID=7740 RepID=A0A8J9ZIL8_BRALA|nr:LGR4 [Branchiostoma lanceolatum]